MQDKQKVTLYLPPGLHRQIKIRAAVDSESMSTIVERALGFYLHHSEVVNEVEADYGKSHQVYKCPECTHPVILRDGEMVTLGNQPGVLAEELPNLEVREPVSSRTESQEAVNLVPC